MEDSKVLFQSIDDLVRKTCKPDEPGAAVIVVKDSKTVYREGFGMANLELGVPIKPDMVFRIGSITKQFTAVATLMLADQGILAIDDPITNFLPEYPTQGHLITVEHLLTHTSGIKSYTELPELWASSRNDFTVQQIIDAFKNRPLDFTTGEECSYNNSGYILLGAIIEKSSGLTYEQFVQHNIFDRLGMKNSYYDDPVRVIPHRVSGYNKSAKGYTNAAYLSMTLPFAGGSLASTVDDLAIWDTALYSEQLVKQETLRRAFTPFRLNDGSMTEFGYGWTVSEYEGHRLIQHGGGVSGFANYAIRVPDQHVFVAVLSNLSGYSPEQLVFEIVGLAIGKPYKEPIPIEVSPEILCRYEGKYRKNAAMEWQFTVENGQLIYRNPRYELVPISTNEFFPKGLSVSRIIFKTDSLSEAISVEIRRRDGTILRAKKVNQ